MNRVEQIDANSAVNTTLKQDGTRFYPATADRFSIHSIFSSQDREEIASHEWKGVLHNERA